MSFRSSGSQQSNASNGAQFGVEMKKLQPFQPFCTVLWIPPEVSRYSDTLEAEHRKLKATSQRCEISRLLRSDFVALFVPLRNLVDIILTCEMILKSPGPTLGKASDLQPWRCTSLPLASLWEVINFVDYSLNQGAPAGHESVETPIGHESNGAVAGEGVKFIVILFQSTCDFHHKFDSGGRLVKRDTPHNKELELSLNIMEATPEDQHSHQGRQDNLNEFRSMRDCMHPPRMSAPSCIVPPTEQLVIRLYLVPLLPTFHGMESENPYAHIKEFEDVCNTFQEGGASIDLMRLKLFPFTLKDKTKIWLNSLRPRSICTWTDLQAEFLKKFFPTHRTNGLKRQISNFSAKENEKFYECWERYMEAINACPHHGFDTWLLVSYFYDGMSSSMKQLLETMCGGDFMSKNPKEAMDFLNYVAEVSRGWYEPTKGEVGKMKSQLSALMLRLGCIP
ncbi:hypothetical protein CK203_019786 [Vitis vinifera]|uniref:Retrotransposon gag domain-containing protein n=1 Tax=Vitis vinifera TaxID=29760 RepID=A0A438JQJ4_VITVI|nr:hypothetical protein CK203_019786 [Vitis vinifera]